MSTWIFICKTNTDFNFGWNYIWQRGWPGLAIFSSKYWNSSPVMELYKRLLQSDILCFQIVFSQPDVWQWLWAWQEERQFCDFSWLIDRGRPNAKDINIAWSLGGLNWAVSWSQIALFLCRLASFLHHLVLRHFFLPLRLLWSEGTANVIVDQTWRSLLVQCWLLIL